MANKSTNVVAADVPAGAIDPTTIDNGGIGKRRRLFKAKHLPPNTVIKELLAVKEEVVKGWVTGRNPMPVEQFYALVRKLDIAPAAAMLMLEEIFHRRVRHLKSVVEGAGKVITIDQEFLFRVSSENHDARHRATGSTRAVAGSKLSLVAKESGSYAFRLLTSAKLMPGDRATHVAVEASPGVISEWEAGTPVSIIARVLDAEGDQLDSICRTVTTLAEARSFHCALAEAIRNANHPNRSRN